MAIIIEKIKKGKVVEKKELFKKKEDDKDGRRENKD